jgi:hypothetical protein
MLPVSNKSGVASDVFAAPAEFIRERIVEAPAKDWTPPAPTASASVGPLSHWQPGWDHFAPRAPSPGHPLCSGCR